jgi:hypothetical protein
MQLFNVLPFLSLPCCQYALEKSLTPDRTQHKKTTTPKLSIIWVKQFDGECERLWHIGLSRIKLLTYLSRELLVLPVFDREAIILTSFFLRRCSLPVQIRANPTLFIRLLTFAGLH